MAFITIPCSVTKIGRGAFYGCRNLASITIPNSVTHLADWAFQDCSGLNFIEIPNSVTFIAYGVFEGCNSLTSIVLSNNIEYVGEKAFACDNLSTIVSMIENPGKVKCTVSGNIYQNNVFSMNTFKNAILYVPVGSIDKYKNGAGWKCFEHITEGLPSGITNTKVANHKEIRRFAIDGHQIETPIKGINIIHMNNGSTRKVYVK